MLCVALTVIAWGLLPTTPIGLAIAGRELKLQAPRMLAGLCLLPTLWLGMRSTLTDLARGQLVLALLSRGLLLGLLLLALARPTLPLDATKVALVVAVDVSDSIGERGLARASGQVRQLADARGDAHVELVTFAKRPMRMSLEQAMASDGRIERHAPSADDPDPGAASNPARALQFAYGLLPAGHLRRVLLIGDGQQTRGDVAAEAQRARELGVVVHHETLTDARPAEIAIEAVDVPEHVRLGETFAVGVRIFSTHATTATVRLYQDDALNGLDALREVELPIGKTRLEFKSVVRAAGDVEYSAELRTLGADRFAQNNRVSTRLHVDGPPRVLVVEGRPGRSAHLARALGAADFDVEVRNALGTPRTAGELAAFDFFILSDVPADRLSSSQMSVIERFVRSGGGFMMAGGESAFGPGGYGGTRMEKLLPVKMDSQRRNDEHSLALALVIDSSGSMSGQKMELAKEAAKATAELLATEDSLVVIGFSGRPERIVRMQSARNRQKIARNIGRLNARGGTAIFPALDLAYQDLIVTRAKVKHVILLTDGQTQEVGIQPLVQQMVAEGITVSTVGLGGDVNRTLLQTAANLGGGRAHFTSDPHNVPRIFMRETTTVGRSNMVEEYFQPHVVDRADFLSGIPIGSAPMLRGYVATEAKPRPVQVVLQSDLGEPVLARWHVGLGWALAWTTDLEARWAADWLRWAAFPRFMGQLVREHMRADSSTEYPMAVERRGDDLHVSVDALDSADRFINDLHSTLTVESSGDGQSTHSEYPMRQIAPGRYGVRVPLRAFGPLELRVDHRRDGVLQARSRGQYVHPYPREYAVEAAGGEPLAAAAAITGGKSSPSLDEAFSAGSERITAHEELWPKLLWLALVVFFLDLLLRRVRLFDRGFKRVPVRGWER